MREEIAVAAETAKVVATFWAIDLHAGESPDCLSPVITTLTAGRLLSFFDKPRGKSRIEPCTTSRSLAATDRRRFSA
jgi:hypothetical protein